MVALANNAVDRLLAALPKRGDGGARFAELGFPTTRDPLNYKEQRRVF